MQSKDISSKLKPLCIVLLSTLLAASAAVIPDPQDGMDVALTEDANGTAAITPSTFGPTQGFSPLDHDENGTLETVSNKSVRLGDDENGEDQKDPEGEDANDDDGDQIYNENENYLDNYDENNDEQDDENGDLDDDEDAAACN